MKLLLSLDVTVLLVSVSTVCWKDRCYLHCNISTLYFVHFLLIVFCILQTFCHDVMEWVCYDRNLALWYFQSLLQTQQPWIKKLRIVFTGLFCVVLHLKHLLVVEVVCISNNEIVKATNLTKNCKGGTWMLVDNLRQTEAGETWGDAGLAARGVLGMILPMVLVMVFSSGIVVGMMRYRLQNTAATPRTHEQAYSAIYITLALSLSFIIAVTATTVYFSIYSKNIKHCNGFFSVEVLRAVFHFLLRFEHVVHILFLATNQTFREELRTLLQATKNYFSNTITEFTETISPHTSRAPWLIVKRLCRMSTSPLWKVLRLSISMCQRLRSSLKEGQVNRIPRWGRDSSAPATPSQNA